MLLIFRMVFLQPLLMLFLNLNNDDIDGLNEVLAKVEIDEIYSTNI